MFLRSQSLVSGSSATHCAGDVLSSALTSALGDKLAAERQMGQLLQFINDQIAHSRLILDEEHDLARLAGSSKRGRIDGKWTEAPHPVLAASRLPL